MPLASAASLVAGQRLAIGQRAERGILLAAGAPRESASSCSSNSWHALDQRRVIALGRAQQVGRLRAVAPPVGTQPRSEVLDRVEIVVGQQNVPRHRIGSPTEPRSNRIVIRRRRLRGCWSAGAAR